MLDTNLVPLLASAPDSAHIADGLKHLWEFFWQLSVYKKLLFVAVSFFLISALFELLMLIVISPFILLLRRPKEKSSMKQP